MLKFNFQINLVARSCVSI